MTSPLSVSMYLAIVICTCVVSSQPEPAQQWTLSPSQQTLLYEKPRDFVRTANASKTSFSEAEKTLLLQLHNAYRSMVQPPATNMREMVWDNDLEEYARQHSQACSGGHSARSMVKVWSPLVSEPWDLMGENLYWSYGDRYSIEEALWMFWEEGSGYNIYSNTCTHHVTCGHYKVLTLEDSWRVGCAINQCERFTDNPYPGPAMFMTCSYNGMYFADARPYSVGETCSGCNRETVGSQFAHCRNRLCVTSWQVRRATGFQGNTTVIGLQHSDFTVSDTNPELHTRDLPGSTPGAPSTTLLPTATTPLPTTARPVRPTTTAMPTAARPVRPTTTTTMPATVRPVRPTMTTTTMPATTRPAPTTTTTMPATTRPVRPITTTATMPATTTRPVTTTTTTMPATTRPVRPTTTTMPATTTRPVRPTTTTIPATTTRPVRPTTTTMPATTTRPATTTTTMPATTRPVPTTTTTVSTTTRPATTTSTQIQTTTLIRTSTATPAHTTPPMRTSTTPMRTSTTPMRTSTTPMRTSTTPMRTSTTPMRTSTTPMRTSTTPMRTTPTVMRRTTPMRTSTTPMRTSTTPMRTTPTAMRRTTPILSTARLMRSTQSMRTPRPTLTSRPAQTSTNPHQRIQFNSRPFAPSDIGSDVTGLHNRNTATSYMNVKTVVLFISLLLTGSVTYFFLQNL